ncbi:MAG: Gfo/Idh/MocA family oxidoreductase, partial [Candidatus Parcubacteria bacterium]|nr:Gfo/Idh/MocA family oxidoreductase [Candidatus Parcubacteria bacterium]
YFDNDEWRGTKKLDGGSLLNQGIHYIDVLQWLLGPVKSVFAKKDRVAHKIEVEDVVVAILHFKNNAYATVEFTICTYPRNLECSISILGSRGTVKIGGQAIDKIEVWEVENSNKPKPNLVPCLAPNVYANGLYQGSCPNHVFIYQEIVNYFCRRSNQHIDGYKARNSLEIVEAIYLSALRKKEIKLPLKILKR